MKTLLTFDVEHWYEGYLHRHITGWEKLPPRDPYIIEKILDHLEEKKQKATFFITGRIAREFPELVKLCDARGHELASHSNEHKVLSLFADEHAFREDVRASRDILSSLTGKPVWGYRAPKWTITPENQKWALRVLAEEGFRYDSSFFPHFGCDPLRKKGRPLRLSLDDGSTILEIPATGLQLGPLCLPVAGGLYFRTFPAWIVKAMLEQKRSQGQSGILYLHPYDLDARFPPFPGGGMLFQLFRQIGLQGAWNKLVDLLENEETSSIAESLPFMPFDSQRL